tara:strand:+ start:1462 stop:1962 length:501 start_codon:yes stop_codon:yes gene_type:complete
MKYTQEELIEDFKEQELTARKRMAGYEPKLPDSLVSSKKEPTTLKQKGDKLKYTEEDRIAFLKEREEGLKKWPMEESKVAEIIEWLGWQYIEVGLEDSKKAGGLVNLLYTYGNYRSGPFESAVFTTEDVLNKSLENIDNIEAENSNLREDIEYLIEEIRELNKNER